MASWWVGLCLLLVIPANVQLLGGLQNQSPDSPDVIDAAHLAITLYNQQNDMYTYSMGRVISAKTQVVAGVLYYLDIEVQRCAKQQDLDMKSCPQSDNTKTFMCHYELWSKPWENFKELVKSQCREMVHQPANSAYDQLVGGLQNQSPDSPDVIDAAHLAITLYNQQNDMYTYSMGRVISAKTQVVAGILYYLDIEVERCARKESIDGKSCPESDNSKTFVCHFELLEMPWENVNKLGKSQCRETVHQPDNSAYDQLVGGLQNQSPDSPDVIDAAHLAITLYNQQNDMYTYSMGRVISAKTQVVAGVLYYLDIEVQRCAKQQDLDMKSCPQSDNTKTFMCHYELWSKPWENFKELVKSQCREMVHQPANSAYDQLVGGLQNQSPDSPDVIDAAHLAITLYNQQNDMYTYSMGRVISAKTQVVAGILYYLDIEVERCARKESIDGKSCPESDNSKTFVCHFELLEMPWENVNKLGKSQCREMVHQPDNSAYDQLVGGLQNQSPDSPDVIDAAHLAITLYNQQNDMYTYSMGRVISAKTQVVAGIMYYLDIEVQRCAKQQSLDMQPFLCHFELLEVPWENVNQLLKSTCSPAPEH